MSKQVRLFITGSAGFICGSLKRRLLAAGNFVIEGYDIRSDIKDDVRDYKRLEFRIRKFRPDGVIHFAAVSRVEEGFNDPKKCIETNICGTANCLEIIRNLNIGKNYSPWFIFASSREVYGEPKKFPVVESDAKNPINIYGVTKLTDEELTKNYSLNYGLKTRVLRFSNVYTGLDDRQSRVIPKFIRLALTNQPLTINGGEQFFDFVYIDDTVEGIKNCIDNLQKSKILYDDFNLVTGKKTGLRELAKLIVELAQSRSSIIFNKARAYDVNCFVGNPSKAKKILNWQARKDIRTGLALVIEEFKNDKTDW